MLKRVSIFVLSALVPILLTQLPIFPLISEMREYSQTGESLSQVWSLVSMPEFYEAARFARVGWLDTTWWNYLVLGVINHAVLLAMFLWIQGILTRLFSKKQTAVVQK